MDSVFMIALMRMIRIVILVWPKYIEELIKGNGLDVGETVIIKDEHGVTHFHIQTLNVYITADLVQQLNVNPQTVQNILASKLKGLSEAVENGKQSQLEDKEKKAEKEIDEEEDDDKKKTKKKKKKGEDEE